MIYKRFKNTQGEQHQISTGDVLIANDIYTSNKPSIILVINHSNCFFIRIEQVAVVKGINTLLGQKI